MGSDRRAQGLAKASQTPRGNLGGAEPPPCEGGRKQVPKPGLRAQGSGKRDAVPPRSREHVFPACSWGPPPMAPFPLALFLIPGNHLPLLLLLTARGSIFSSLSGRKKPPQQPTFARSLTQTPSWGTCYPSLEKARTPATVLAQDTLDLAGCPPHLQLVLDPPAGRRSRLRAPQLLPLPPSPQPGLGPSTELHLHQP